MMMINLIFIIIHIRLGTVLTLINPLANPSSHKMNLIGIAAAFNKESVLSPKGLSSRRVL